MFLVVDLMVSVAAVAAVVEIQHQVFQIVPVEFDLMVSVAAVVEIQHQVFQIAQVEFDLMVSVAAVVTRYPD